MADKSCVICGGSESDGEVLLRAPCQDHWVCIADVGSFFRRATESESLFPPKCCEQMFILDEYEEHVPFDIAWQFRVKEQGEYAILAKFRVYCGDPKCTKFLHPSSHITNDAAGLTYAICEDEACGKTTCIGCKLPLENGIAGHVCKKDENEEAFKQEVSAKGYQLCSICNTTIELIEACNHITCECGHDFCYVCGKEWLGLHACPHYGPPKYDEDGYNQDGYHCDTGLNHDGLTRRQDLARRRGENPDEMDEDEDIREEDDPDWEVLQHLTADQRAAVNALPEEARDEALDGLRIELFETRGLVFGPGPEADEQFQDDDEDEDGGEGEEQGDDLEQQALNELFEIFHPMITRLPAFPIGLPNFPQAMHEALALSSPQRVQEFLALMDPTYSPATNTLVVDFDRERISFVAEALVDRVAATGADVPAMDDMERLLFAVLPHVITRAGEREETEADAGEQADYDHDELYTGPDDVGMGAGNDSSSADDAGPQTPSEVMEVFRGPGVEAERGEAAGKVQGPPGGWPEVEEELD